MQESKSADVGGEATESNTGRWTKAEHELFLRGLAEFGKDWKQIGSLIKTRTVVQIRTHAEKYFLANKKHDPEGGSQVTEVPAKPSTGKKRATSTTKAKSKKKKEGEENLDNLDKIFDLVDAWSSGSDEGTPTSLDELDFLKGPVLSPFPSSQNDGEAPQHNLQSQQAETATIPMQHVHAGVVQPISQQPHRHPHSLPTVSTLEQHHHQQQQYHHQQHPQIHHQQGPHVAHGRQPEARPAVVDSTFVEMTGSELHDLPTTFDPLPPSLEYVLLGRWMDTMTE